MSNVRTYSLICLGLAVFIVCVAASAADRNDPDIVATDHGNAKSAFLTELKASHATLRQIHAEMQLLRKDVAHLKGVMEMIEADVRDIDESNWHWEYDIDDVDLNELHKHGSPGAVLDHFLNAKAKEGWDYVEFTDQKVGMIRHDGYVFKRRVKAKE